MASVYILYSTKLTQFYTGSCLDLSYRLNLHVSKEFAKSFTTKTDDWELYFFRDNLSYEQARRIESHIKKMKSIKYIQDLKKYPEIIEKLILKYKS